MAVVAVVGVLLAAADWQKRRVAWRAYCRETVRYHANWEKACRSEALGLSRSASEHTELAEDMRRSDKERRWARYCAKVARRGARQNAVWTEFHGRLREKWRVAANGLWMEAAPDPPEP
jgi:hypothetical protein